MTAHRFVLMRFLTLVLVPLLSVRLACAETASDPPSSPSVGPPSSDAADSSDNLGWLENEAARLALSAMLPIGATLRLLPTPQRGSSILVYGLGNGDPFADQMFTVLTRPGLRLNYNWAVSHGAPGQALFGFVRAGGSWELLTPEAFAASVAQKLGKEGKGLVRVICTACFQGDRLGSARTSIERFAQQLADLLGREVEVYGTAVKSRVVNGVFHIDGAWARAKPSGISKVLLAALKSPKLLQLLRLGGVALIIADAAYKIYRVGSADPKDRDRVIAEVIGGTVGNLVGMWVGFKVGAGIGFVIGAPLGPYGVIPVIVFGVAGAILGEEGAKAAYADLRDPNGALRTVGRGVLRWYDDLYIWKEGHLQRLDKWLLPTLNRLGQPRSKSIPSVASSLTRGADAGSSSVPPSNRLFSTTSARPSLARSLVR